MNIKAIFTMLGISSFVCASAQQATIKVAYEAYATPRSGNFTKQLNVIWYYWQACKALSITTL